MRLPAAFDPNELGSESFKPPYPLSIRILVRYTEYGYRTGKNEIMREKSKAGFTYEG